MSGTGAPVSAYRGLVRLYPRPFRDEYGADMVAVFGAQLRDEAAWRVCTRAAVDLVLTVPTRRLEAHMNRSANRVFPVAFLALAVAGLVLATVTGELAPAAWVLAMAAFVGSWILLAAGAILGVARLGARVH
ncbi:hypothetical protein [Sporichthya sp.]|uniref:hypothetical protein n=1 Tax=Sporichthya sp. TaxID=65475 RepID=UPI0017C4FE7F|nr:hypothetical protein [Sporichthya sp.]MBA3743670.1 hypothetical protein [Sporichthya sp.]